MRRREFITLIGGAAVAWPITARAQQRTPVVGFLHSESATTYADLNIEYRWAESHNERLSVLAAELVSRRVDVIVTPASTAATLAAKAATATIPIVFVIGTDPVKIGLVASLNRPGGNVTGISDIGVQLGAKRLALLQELLPGATRFAMLVNPDNPLVTDAFVTELQAAASAIGRQIEVISATKNSEIDTAFATLAKKQIEAFLTSPDAMFFTRRVQLTTLATRHALPALYHRREFADAGGLMSYGSSLADQFRQTGVCVGRILKGGKPSEIPVQLPAKFEFIINLQTARSLSINIPTTLLARADEVIE